VRAAFPGVEMLSFWRRQIVFACVGTVLLVAGAASVQAEDVDAIIKKGTDLRRKGRDAEALTEFRRAAKIQSSPRVTAQIGLAEQALGLWLDANTHVSQALESHRDPWIAKNLKALERALATIQGHLTQLEVWGSPDGAEILIDGKRVGALPTATVWVAPGDVPLEIKADGYTSASRVLKVTEGGRLREHVELRLVPPVVATGPTRSEEMPGLRLQASDQGAGAADKDSGAAASGGGHHRWWLWTLIGVGVLSAGGAGAWFLTHRKEPCDPANCTSW